MKDFSFCTVHNAWHGQCDMREDPLRFRHIGRPGVVMGSGPSLPDHLAKTPEESVLISINTKPMKLVKPDYVVFADLPTAQETLTMGIPRISILEEYSDFELPPDAWFNGISGTLALWAACHMGCDPVLLAGIDCYVGENTHFYEPGINQSQKHVHEYPINFHFRAWAPAIERCPNSRVIQAIGGPLEMLFGKWDGEYEKPSRGFLVDVG